MANSDPSIQSAEIPPEAQPNNRFTFDVTVRQGGPDPWASDGGCTTSTLDVTGWQTPVALFVDGEKVDENTMCLAPDNSKTTTLSTSLSEGQHDLRVVVYSMGGNGYDLQPVQQEENDSVRQTVAVHSEASDPSRPTTSDAIMQYLSRIAEALGGTTQQVAAGMVLAVVLLVVL